MSTHGAGTPAAGSADNNGGQAIETETTETEGETTDDETGEEADNSDDDNGDAEDEGGEVLEEGEDGEGEEEAPAAEPETLEIEADDGTKHKVPKALERSFLRQQDYTQKTQALAEEKKTFQAQQATAVANIKDVARLHNIHEQIQSYEKVDWDTLQQQDPDAAATHWRKFTLLKDEAGQVAQTIHRNESEAQANAERERANRLATAVETCAKEIPGWSPTYAQQLADLAVSTAGFSKDEVRGIDDPRMFKILHRLAEAEKTAKTAAKVQKHLAPQKTQPAPVAKSAGAKPQSKDLNKMSTAQFVEMRRKQLAG